MRMYPSRTSYAAKILLSLFVIALSSPALAVVVQGDMPNSLTRTLEIYNDTQSSPCDGSADSGSALYITGTGTGDGSYDDDNDYNVTANQSAATQWIYIYYCDGSSRIANLTKYSYNTSYTIDLGQVKDDGNGVHANLNNDYVFVCSNPGGTELDTVSVQINTAAATDYTQFYPIDEQNTTVAYVFFDDDTTSPCDLDSTKSTGKRINVTLSAENNGILVQWSPEARALGDLHMDLDNAILHLFDSNGKSVGMLNQSVNATADGTSDGGDDYTLYYDNPASGTFTLNITPDGTNIPAASVQTITGIANGFTSGYDFLHAVKNATNGIADDITHVRIITNVTTTGIIQTVPATVSGSVKVFNLYTDMGATDTPVLFLINNTVVLNRTRVLNFSVSGVARNVTISAGRVSGDVALSLGAGSNDYIYVHNASNTVTCSDSDTLKVLNSRDVNLLSTSSPDYTQYFEADASATYRLRSVKDSSYHTCGNTFTLTNLAASVDLDAEVSGVVQTDIGRVALDASEGNDMSPGSTDVYTDNITGGQYYIYSSDSTALSAPMDSAVDVLFAETNNATITVLERDKNLAISGNVSLNVSRVYGILHMRLNDSTADAVEVYTDVDAATRQSNTDNAANSTYGRDTGYNVYFEHDSTKSFHMLRFLDNNKTYYSFAKTVVGAAGNQSINLTNLIHGAVPAALSTVWLDDDSSVVDDQPFFAGTVNSSGQYQIFHNQSTISSYLNADGDTNEANGANLTRFFTPSAGNSTFDAARVLGDAHANLQGGSDVLRICTTIACTNRTSSDNMTPQSALTPDYALYFEVPSAGTSEVILYINDTDASINNYTTYVNLSGVQIASISPGNSIGLNLTNQINGTTPGSLVRLWMREGNAVATGRWNYTADIINGTYRLYYNFTGSSQAFQFDENTDETGTNLNFTKTLTDFPTSNVAVINVSEIKGDLPSQFNGDLVEIELTQNQACNGASYSSDAVSDGGSPDYRAYVEANGTTRYAVFCDGTTRELERSSATNIGGAVHVMDVSRLAGNVHPDLLATSQIPGFADNITIHNASTCVGSAISTEPEQPASDAYTQYYETAAAGTTFYINATAVINMTFGTDTHTNYNFTSCVKFTTSGGGNANTINLTALLNGTVQSDVFSVAVDNNTDNSTDAFTNIAVGSRSGEYRLYTYTMDNTDFVYSYSQRGAAGRRLLNRSANLLDLQNLTLNVSRVNGTLHLDLQNTAAGDAIRVYRDSRCGTQISSEDLVDSSDNNYTQFYERPDIANFLYLKITDDTTYYNYTTCLNSTVAMDSVGGSVAYNATVKINGTLPTGLVQVYADPEGSGSSWEINSTVVTGTTPDSYAIYYNGSTLVTVNFTSDATTSKLVRASKSFTHSAAAASLNYTVNVSSISGEAHTDLETGTNDLISVWNLITCTGTQLSNQSVNPADASGTDYTQYFEGQANGTAYYINVTFNDDSRNFTTCYRTGFTLNSANENATVGFDRKVSGEVPDHSNSALTTDILTVGADVDGSGNDYLGIVADNGTDSLYRLYVNSTLGSAGDMVNFYSDTASTLKLNKTKSMAADLEVNVSAVYGETHEDLEAAGNAIAVCDEIASFSSFGVCGTVAHSTVLEEPSSNKYASANDFEVFFEQEDGDTGYFLQVNDSESVSQFFSYRNFTSTTGSTVNVSADGKLMGNVTEAYNTALNISNVNVTVKDNGNTFVLATTITNNTGDYRLYASVINVVDIRFEKANYLQKDSVTNGDSAVPDLNDVTLSASINTTMETGVKVIVKDYNTNDLITDATVTLYNCTSTTVSSCTQTILLCGTPSGNCQRTGGNTAGNGQNGQYNFANIGNSSYFQIKIERTNYTTKIDPDPASGTGATYQINGSVQPQGLATDYTYFLQPLAAGTPSLLDPNDTYVTADNTPTFTWSSVAGSIMYEIIVDDNSDFSSYNITANVTTASFTPAVAITDAKYYWKVRSYSSANQSGSWSNTRTLTTDTTAPSASTLTRPFAGYNLSGSILINASGSDATAGIDRVEFFKNDCGSGPVGNATAQPYAVTWATTAADDGSRIICARVIDKAGNSLNASTVTITVDNTNPTASVSSPSNGMTINGTWIITTSVSDGSGSGVNKVEFYIDGALNATDTSSTYTFDWVTSLTGDGTHSIKAKAYDNANNTVESSIVSVTVDNTAPQSVAITTPANNTNANGNLTIVAAASDAVGIKNVTFFNDSTSVIGTDTSAPWSVQWDTSGTTDGAHLITAVVGDNVNNTLTSVAITVIVDNTVPSNVTSVTPATTTTDTDGSVTWNWDPATDGSGSGINYYRVEVDENAAGTFAFRSENITTATYYTITDLTNSNNYTLRVKAVDKVGLSSSAWLTSGTVIIDKTAPGVASIVTPNVNKYTNATSAAFNVTVDSDVSFCRFRKYINGTAQFPVQSAAAAGSSCNVTVTGLSDAATVYVAVTVNDTAGNTNGEWISLPTYTIDATTPTISISSPQNTTITVNTTAITFTVNDTVGSSKINATSIMATDSSNSNLAFSSANCDIVDNGRTYNCTYKLTTGFNQGSHTLRINATDVSGNFISVTRNFVVNTSVTVNASLTASDTAGIADGSYDNGWSWTFRISTGTGGNAVRFRVDNWTSGSNIMATFNNTKLTYTNSTNETKTYWVREYYDETQSVDALKDDDSAVDGTQTNVTVSVKIPTGTVSGSYSTTYAVGLYNV